MPDHNELSRRIFLERLAAGALLGATAASHKSARADSTAGAWQAPPVLKNPNILIIMVDELRPPMWMNTAQSSTLSQTVLPNIMGRILNNAYNFEQMFVAATICTASRATLLTGLYAPQTAVYVNNDSAGAPDLNSAFPTFAQAVPALNPAYQGNLWWFGKWHLSAEQNTNPLSPYGFKTRTYPGGPAANPSPNGGPNEGTDGGQFNQKVWASDAMIAGDFVGWLQGQQPTPGQPPSPWCATVSFVNPHDIGFAPAWFQSSSYPPGGLAAQPIYFPPPSGNPPAFYANEPSPWNKENLPAVPNKPSLQVNYFNYLNQAFGSIPDYTTFLNQYFWLQNLLDAQVGKVLDALNSSAFAANTIVIFLSDHGEFAGSHGLRTKGWAVYDEALSVPFYIHFPGQTGSIPMNQMCSGVDFFGLICDLAASGSGQWRLAYPDLANRQSIWSFLYNNSSETRVAPAPIGIPYILHTFDASPQNAKSHIVCMRTKLDVANGAVGGKLAFYSTWAPCTTYPDNTPEDAEFYDYNPQTAGNTSEMGNDYYSKNPTTQSTIAQYTQVLGSLAPPVAGLCGSELNSPLVGKDVFGNPLSQAQAVARETFYNYLSGAGVCPTS